MLNFVNVFCSRRRWAKRLLMNHLDDIASVYLKTFNLEIFYNPKDLTGPSFHLAYDLDKGFKNYEEIEKNELLDAIPENGVFVDIGANIGMFSLYILNKRPDIVSYAFEPEPLNFDYISKTKNKNELNNLKLFNVAVGEKVEKLKLYKSNKNDGGHSLVLDHSIEDDNEVSTVQVMPLGQILPSDLEKIHAIKIDVEGAEANVLKGALSTISKYKPVLLIESSNIDLANKENLYSILFDNFKYSLLARIPGSQNKMTLPELSKLAQSRLDQKIYVNNYFFECD